MQSDMNLILILLWFSVRCFWAPSLLILLGLAIVLVMMTVKRYQDNPTYMVQLDKVYEIERFPSVVLCPEVNFVDEKMERFLTTVKYPPGMNITLVREILPQLAAFYSLDVLYNLHDLVRLEQLLDYNGLDVVSVSKLLTATCEESLIKCRWGRFIVNCSHIFRMELTGDGFCCVFNGRSLRREIEEHGYEVRKTKPHDHWYTTTFGHTSGLLIAVNQSQAFTTVDLTYKWISLQASQHFVDTTMNGSALNPGAEQWIAVSTRGFQIALGARTLKPSLRKCNMANEGLRFFPMYTQEGCLLEKEIDNTLEKCKCIRITHPKPPGASYCKATRLHCSAQALIAIDDTTPECPMTCDIEFTIVKGLGFTLDDSVTTVEPFYRGLNFKKVSVVRIFIQSRNRPTLERWSYFDYIDLFSQIGGMFSVFFGCSILTLIGLLQLSWRVLVTQYHRLAH